MKKVLFLLLLTFIGICVTGNTELWAQETAPSLDGPAWINPALYLAYAMVIIAAGAAIILPLLQAAGDPKALLKSGAGLLAIVVIFFIAYAISGNEVRPIYEQFGVTPGSSKVIGGGLIASYLLVFIALAGIIYTEVTGILNRN